MNEVKFERKTYSTGNSICVTLPEELRNYLGLDDGAEVILMPDSSKHGKFIAMWKKEDE